MNAMTSSLEPASNSLPVIDISKLLAATPARAVVAEQIGRACRQHGFFYVVGHGVDLELCARLESLSRRFFALDEATKMQWRMALGGRAWRGYFPVGGELTSGHPDWKEGLYMGSELPQDHPLVQGATPLHGRNLFPSLPGFRETALAYIDALTRLGHTLMEGIALSLGLVATLPTGTRQTHLFFFAFSIIRRDRRPRLLMSNGAWVSTATTVC
jgi:polar amino acid transport system ATP-binding protein